MLYHAAVVTSSISMGFRIFLGTFGSRLGDLQLCMNKRGNGAKCRLRNSLKLLFKIFSGLENLHKEDIAIFNGSLDWLCSAWILLHSFEFLHKKNSMSGKVMATP